MFIYFQSEFVSWSSFFAHSFPVFFPQTTGAEAQKLFNDAQVMLKDIISRKLLHCAGVIGFYRAQSNGDDIDMFDSSGNLLSVLHGLRQQV